MFAAETKSDEGLSSLCPETLQLFYMPAIVFVKQKNEGSGKFLFVLLKASSGFFILFDSFGTC